MRRARDLVPAVILAMGAASCAWWSANGATVVSDIKTAEADVLEAIPVACAVADAVDPTGATAVCAVLDAAGNAIITVTVKTPSPSAAKALVAAHPAPSPAAAALLSKARKL